jgi:ABC-type transporter Mla subunit MlaD
MDEPQGISESKEQKFVRLATKRTQAAIQKIKLIGNLSASSYGYNPDQVQRVIGSLRQAVDDVEKRFNKLGGKTSQSFSL